RTEQRLVAYQQRRLHFGVAVLLGMEVEHELPERALEPRELALQHHEAAAAQLRRHLEVHVAGGFAELVMLPRREREAWPGRPLRRGSLRRAVAAEILDVGALVLADRDVTLGQV